MPVDPDGFAIADRSWELPDPPDIAGDHVALCMGCPKCEAEEAEYYANREKYDAQREAWIAKHAPAIVSRDLDAPYRAHALNITVAMAKYVQAVKASRWWEVSKRKRAMQDMRDRFAASERWKQLALAYMEDDDRTTIPEGSE